MPAYNPQLDLEFTVLNDDGTESPMTIDLFTGLDGVSYADLNHHDEWKPLNVECSVSKSLGGTQDQATITIHNTPYIEIFRKDYRAELNKIRNQKWRVRIYAWYDDNGTVAQSPRPTMAPVFVGDITEDFNVVSSGINDTSLQFQALGHGWLARSGKMKKTWAATSTYLNVVTDLFDYMINVKKYGRETIGATPKYVILPDARLNKTRKRGFSIDRNPIETMNDICRDIDFVWGIHNNIPYILPRDKSFGILTDYPSSVTLPSTAIVIRENTGATSLANYSKYTFGFSSQYSEGILIGRYVQLRESDQVKSNGFGYIGIGGRLNEMEISLSNYGSGHQMDANASYFDGGDVVLPPKRADNSGLRNE